MNEFGVYHTGEKNQMKSLQAGTGRDVATAACEGPTARPRRKPPWDAILILPPLYIMPLENPTSQTDRRKKQALRIFRWTLPGMFL